MMQHLLSPTCVLLVAALATPRLEAQLLYSQSLSRPASALTLSLRLDRVQPNTTFSVVVTAPVTLQAQAPATVRSDARGYALLRVDVRNIVATGNPMPLKVTISDASLPNGSLSRSWLLKAKNGRLYSAWPDVVMAQGAFCSPADSASSHLEIDRASDLDGDGYYGDVNIERNGDGRDPLDFPSEFASDVNATGSKATVPSPPGLYLPGGAGRTVAFCADTRVVSTTTACTFTTRLNFVEDIRVAPSFNGKPALFATSSSNDNVLICRDLDGDGSIGPSEIKVFFDPVALVSSENYSPDAIVLDPTNSKRLWWITDKSGPTGPVANQGLFRLDDTNGDDVIGATEWKACWTGSTPAVVVEGKTIDPSEFECAWVDSKGAVLLNQVDLGTILRWVDANQNGVAETGEVTNWLTYNMASTLTKSADFQLPSFPIITATYFAMNLMVSAPRTGQGDVYFVALTNSTGPGAGFVFRCEDRNNNGSANDTAEVTVFNDPALSSDPYPPNFISGLDVAQVDVNGNGTIEPDEAYPNGPRPSIGYLNFNDLAIWRHRDLNGNGTATDAGESERVMIHPTGAFNRSIALAPPELDGGFRPTFYQRSQATAVRTGGCQTPAGEAVALDAVCDKLEEGTQGTPFGGNGAFTLVTRGNGVVPGTVCGVAFATAIAAAPLPLLGCDLWLTPPLWADLLPATLPDANGVAKFALPVPAAVRGTLALQAVTLLPTQLVLGEACEVRVE